MKSTNNLDLPQSYLILGKSHQSREETIKLLASRDLFLSQASPDVFIVAPQTKHITIDQIREIKKHIFQKPVSQKYKIIILENAGVMTLEAQNAILKILEEPPKTAIIILETTSRRQLLSTILSRVTRIEANFKEQDIDLELFDENVLENTTSMSDLDNWLNDQIIALTKLLIAKKKTKSAKYTTKILLQAIEKCAKTKEMIDANVNPKFAIIELILSLRGNSTNTRK